MLDVLNRMTYYISRVLKDVFFSGFCCKTIIANMLKRTPIIPTVNSSTPSNQNQIFSRVSSISSIKS